MKMSSVAKSAAIALLAIAIAPQTVIVPKTSHDRSSEFVVKSKSVGRNITLETDKLNDYEQDQVEYLIMQIINSDKNTVELDGVYYTYSDLYRSPEEKAGYVIDFTYGEAYGYMLIISDENSVTPAEVVLQRRSPYYGKEGKYLYPPNGGYYIMTDNGEIMCAESRVANENTPQKVALLNSDKRSGIPVKVTYEYHRGKYNEVYEIENFDFGFKFYDDDIGLKNYCANVAGVIALNYWNKFYDNKLLNLVGDDLIEDTNIISHKKAKDYLKTFYKYMKTNWLLGSYGGTLPEDCYNGFSRLIDECGFRTDRIETTTYDKMRKYLKRGIPIFITSTNYYFSHNIYTMPDFPLREDENTLTLDSRHSYGVDNAHTFIGYGCTQLYLYDKDGNLSTVDLIRVADGWGGACYFNLNESSIYSAVALRVMLPLPRC